jgi:hypothetical protein
MTREDTKIIFSNIAELALFSDMFVERLEQALGSVLDGGVGDDFVGALFLEIVRLPSCMVLLLVRLTVRHCRYRLWNLHTSPTSHDIQRQYHT